MLMLSLLNYKITFLFVFILRRGRVHISRILNTKTKSSAAQECHQNGEGSPPMGSHGQGGGGNWTKLWRERRSQEKIGFVVGYWQVWLSFSYLVEIWQCVLHWRISVSAEGAALKPLAWRPWRFLGPARAAHQSFFSAHLRNLKKCHLLAACWLPDAAHYYKCNSD